MGGYVLLWRKYMNSDLWAETTTLHKTLVMVLLMKATWQRADCIIDGARRTLQPGELFRSERELAEYCGKDVTRKMVRLALNRLEMLGFIRLARFKKGTLISIVNWETYQKLPDGVIPDGEIKKPAEKEKTLSLAKANLEPPDEENGNRQRDQQNMAESDRISCEKEMSQEGTGTNDGHTKGPDLVTSRDHPYKQKAEDRKKEKTEKTAAACADWKRQVEEGDFFGAPPSDALWERLDALRRRYGESWLMEALGIARDRGNRRIPYVEGILRSWKEKGYDGPGKQRKGKFGEDSSRHSQHHRSPRAALARDWRGVAAEL